MGPLALGSRGLGTRWVYHILLVALEVFPWSEEDTSLPFQGWCCSLLEGFLAVVDTSSSVFEEGPSNP